MFTVHKPRGTICFLNAPLAEFTHQCLKNSNKSIFGHDNFSSNGFIQRFIISRTVGGCDRDSYLFNKVTIFKICGQYPEIRQNSWAMSVYQGMLWSKLHLIIFILLSFLSSLYCVCIPYPSPHIWNFVVMEICKNLKNNIHFS